MAMEHPRLMSEQSFVHLLSGVAAGAGELAAAHAEQLQNEVSEQVATAKAAGIRLTAGAALAAVGSLFLLVAMVAVLSGPLGWPSWAAWLLVGGVAVGIGVALMFAGRRRLEEVGLVPKRTLHSIRETLSCLANGRN